MMRIDNIIGCCSKTHLKEKHWYRDGDTEENNAAARRAYESLMTITLRKPDSPKYVNFSRHVKKRAREHSGDGVFTYDEGVGYCVYFISISASKIYQCALNMSSQYRHRLSI